MAVLSKDEFITRFNDIIGDNTDDNVISFLEDIDDTFESYGEDWKTKYEQNDSEWRQRYKERFLNKSDEKEDLEEDTEEIVTPENKILTYDELFE